MSRKKNNQTIIDIFYGAMLAVIVGIMPLIVQLAERVTPPELLFLFNSPIYHEVFSYWKGFFMVVPALLMVIFIVFKWLTGGDIPILKPYYSRVPIILSFVFLGFTFLSAIFSSYNHIAWFGTRDRDEGALMWLIYFIAFASAMFYVREPKHIRPILWGLTFCGVIMGAIGLSQLLGDGFFATAFATRLVTANTEIEYMRLNFDIAHGTLYNPNTFGKFTAMVAPILMVSAMTYGDKRKKGTPILKSDIMTICVKTLMFIGGLLMLVGVFASGSLGGLIGITTATIVLVGAYIFRIFSSSSKLLRGNILRVAAVFSGVATMVVLAIFFVPELNHRATTLFNRLQVAAAAETTTAARYVFDTNNVHIYRGQEVLLSIEIVADGLDSTNFANWKVVRDGAGNILSRSSHTPHTENSPTRYVYNVPELGSLTLSRWLYSFEVGLARQRFPFFLSVENGYIYGFRHPQGERVNLSDTVPAWGFEGRETWGSSRGYIWSRTLPLLPRRVILGSGPDTFTLAFPHYDMAGLQLAFNNPYQIVDKAHNLFLQTWVGNGGIAAIALFALFGHYLVSTLKSIKNLQDVGYSMHGIQFGLLSGISAFVMSSMATDSTIGSTGVFFVLLGMGYGINYFLQNKKLV